jgi:hypothetical protein
MILGAQNYTPGDRLANLLKRGHMFLTVRSQYAWHVRVAWLRVHQEGAAMKTLNNNSRCPVKRRAGKDLSSRPVPTSAIERRRNGR